MTAWKNKYLERSYRVFSSSKEHERCLRKVVVAPLVIRGYIANIITGGGDLINIYRILLVQFTTFLQFLFALTACFRCHLVSFCSVAFSLIFIELASLKDISY